MTSRLSRRLHAQTWRAKASARLITVNFFVRRQQERYTFAAFPHVI